ncbi:MAG: hypothetical protein IT208_11885 [Chthonomonadales bacterium]|nr:hypothetical protein [Chthonomonadales bacterium]
MSFVPQSLAVALTALTMFGGAWAAWLALRARTRPARTPVPLRRAEPGFRRRSRRR